MSDDTTDTPTRILDAAERAFADHGLAGARVASIADDAGVNKAMLYYYFKSKEDLHTAVLERVFGQIVEMAEGVGSDAGAPPEQALAAFMDGYARILGEHPHIVRIMLRGVLDSPEETVGFIGPRLRGVMPVVVGRVTAGQAAGRLNPRAVPPLVPPVLIAPLVMFAFARPVLEAITGFDPDLLAQMWVQNAQEIVLNGLVARPTEE